MPLNPDRLFPPEPAVRDVARALYAGVKDLPILSPHGHTEPRWYAENEAFPDPVSLFVRPDHYIFRMLYSQGVSLEELGIPDRQGEVHNSDNRAIWRLFAKHWFLFRGTPSRVWLERTTRPSGSYLSDVWVMRLRSKSAVICTREWPGPTTEETMPSTSWRSRFS